MASSAYLAKNPSSQAAMPKPIAQPIKSDGTFQTDIWRYLNALTAPPPQEILVTLGPSPTSFKAPVTGTLFVSGGTVSAINYQRMNSYPTGATSGTFQMSSGDSVQITYSAAPTVTWFPGAASPGNSAGSTSAQAMITTSASVTGVGTFTTYTGTAYNNGMTVSQSAGTITVPASTRYLLSAQIFNVSGAATASNFQANGSNITALTQIQSLTNENLVHSVPWILNSGDVITYHNSSGGPVYVQCFAIAQLP